MGRAKRLQPATPLAPPIEYIATRDLYLDSRNPRLRADVSTDQGTLLRMLWEDGSLEELALSIERNGFFPTEPLFAVKEDGKNIVVEGNRRLAIVKLLRDRQLRERLRATDLPELTAEQLAGLDQLPVCFYPNRRSLWAYVGFRHVKGPLTWDSWSKAQYIAYVFNTFKVPLSQIAETIGDTNQTVQRLYRGLMVLDQAVKRAGYSLEDRAKSHLSFSHLYTGLDYAGFQRHVGLPKNGGFKPDPIPKRKLGNLKELMVWLYGSREEDKPPLVRTQNPDLKRLDDVLKEPKALSALRAELGLEVAYQLTRGESARLRELLTHARYDLQQARGFVLGGFRGERDLVEMVQSICDLADSLRQDLGTRPSRVPTR